MIDDISFLSDPNRWPGEVCCVKTDPRRDGPREFGIVHRDAPLTVSIRSFDQSTIVRAEHFSSVEEMAQKWIVD